ncbi:hypothetical protein RI367_002109 [Sorochytrium milnesiophthora]
MSAIHDDDASSSSSSHSSHSSSAVADDDEGVLTSPQRRRVLALLILAYSASYLSRSPLNSVTPAILDGDKDVSSMPSAKQDFGIVLSTGYVGYALGFLATGPMIDALGPRKMMTAGLAGASVSVMLFALPVRWLSVPGRVPYLSWWCLCWTIARVFQATGWGCLIKLISAHFPVHTHGRVCALVSVSYGVGDALIRLLSGWILALGLGWRAAVGGLAALVWIVGVWPAWRYLRDRPASADGRTMLARLLSGNPRFWVLSLLAPSVTFVRETFNDWLSLFLVEHFGVSPANSSALSLVFPLCGTCSLLAGGFLYDHAPRLAAASSFAWIPHSLRRHGRRRRSSSLPSLAEIDPVDSEPSSSSAYRQLSPTSRRPRKENVVGVEDDSATAPRAPDRQTGIALLSRPLLACSLLFISLTVLLLQASWVDVWRQWNSNRGVAVSMLMVSLTGLFLIAPASFVDGVLAMDVAPPHLQGLTVGVIEMCASVGGIMAGRLSSHIITDDDHDGGGAMSGWRRMFVALTGSCAVAVLLMLVSSNSKGGT